MQKNAKSASPKNVPYHVGNVRRLALVKIQDDVELKIATTFRKSWLKGCQFFQYLVVY